MKETPRNLLALAALVVLTAAPASAQSPAPTAAKATQDSAFKAEDAGLFANADLSYVLTAGNASSSSLGFKGDLTRRWEKHSIALAAGGIRASSSPDARFAVGTPEDAEVRLPDSERTAESYFGRARYGYKLKDRLFYVAGGSWERNRFAGVENRWTGDTGVGYHLLNDERTSFRAVATVTFTKEEQVVDGGGAGSFLGARLGWDFSRKLGGNTTLTHTLVADENLEETDDLRADSQLGLHVAMSERLGLKVNWRLLWDNQPALALLPLYSPDLVPTGLDALVPNKKLDQGFSVSLVFKLAPAKS